MSLVKRRRPHRRAAYNKVNIFPFHVQLDNKVQITSDLKEAVTNAEIITSVVATSHGIRPVCERLKEVGITNDQILVNASKGIELPGLLRMSEVIKASASENKICVLSGPTLAKEVLDGLRQQRPLPVKIWKQQTSSANAFCCG